VLLALIMACGTDPQPLPSEEEALAATEGMVEVRPPMVQLLYDYAFLPEVQAKEQRVRILVWLRWMEFDGYQLRALREAWEKAEGERTRIDERQAAVIADYEPQVGEVYDEIWAELVQGKELSDPAVLAAAEPLVQERMHKNRERELLELRLQGIDEVLRHAEPVLNSLTQQQEARLADSLFFLRHSLDPYANPGDFNALVGTTFSPGDYGTLKRGQWDPATDHNDLGMLWSEPETRGSSPVFADVKKELLVYLILLEPTLPEAVAAEEASRTDEPRDEVPPGPKGEPTPAPEGSQEPARP
jgi:hypothetical protein